MEPRILTVIPARSGSKRIPGKNTRLFCGRPLIEYTIEQALKSSVKGRVVVDTDSEEVASLAKKAGAEVPFLRPPELATDTAQLPDSLVHLVNWLESEEGYTPEYVMVLQTTSPLREEEDIVKVWDMMEGGNATSVVTVCKTHPRLYHLEAGNSLVLVNGSESQSTNMQEWRDAYVLNGCFVYLVKTATLKAEKRLITKNAKAVVCDAWRSVDLDTPEDWVIAELLFENRARVRENIARIATPSK